MASRIITVVLLAIFAISGVAQRRPIPQSTTCAPGGIAVDGYDIVSYYSGAAPMRGAAEFAIGFEGLTYLFGDAHNQALFRAHPDDYLPEYDGWCAASVAHGSLLCPDFSNFKLESGRLLFFEVTAFTNGRALWDSDPRAYRQRADQNFPVLTAQ